MGRASFAVGCSNCFVLSAVLRVLSLKLDVDRSRRWGLPEEGETLPAVVADEALQLVSEVEERPCERPTACEGCGSGSTTAPGPEPRVERTGPRIKVSSWPRAKAKLDY